MSLSLLYQQNLRVSKPISFVSTPIIILIVCRAPALGSTLPDSNDLFLRSTYEKVRNICG